MKTSRLSIIALAASFAAASQAGVVASYGFQGTLAADQNGIPTLTAYNSGSFGTTTMLGVTRQGYTTNGSNSSLSANAGLQLDASSLLTSGGSYSVQLVFSASNDNNTDGYQKLFDTSGRSSDDGLYIDPGNTLGHYSGLGSNAYLTPGTFNDVIETFDSSTGIYTGYLNGVLAYSGTASDPGLDASQPLSFFLDDSHTSGREFTDVTVGEIRLWNNAITQADVTAFTSSPFAQPAPEPCTMAIIAAGAGLAIWRKRRS